MKSTNYPYSTGGTVDYVNAKAAGERNTKSIRVAAWFGNIS